MVSDCQCVVLIFGQFFGTIFFFFSFLSENIQSAIEATETSNCWCDSLLNQKEKQGRKDIPDVNSELCTAPVCGHKSFVYLSC